MSLRGSPNPKYRKKILHKRLKKQKTIMKTTMWREEGKYFTSVLEYTMNMKKIYSLSGCCTDKRKGEMCEKTYSKPKEEEISISD